MTDLTIGIRDLKAHLSEYLQAVKRGQTILVTEHGKPVGRILPAGNALDDQVEALRTAGLLAWNGKKLSPIEAPAVNRGDRPVSDILLGMRE